MRANIGFIIARIIPRRFGLAPAVNSFDSLGVGIFWSKIFYDPCHIELERIDIFRFRKISMSYGQSIFPASYQAPHRPHLRNQVTQLIRMIDALSMSCYAIRSRVQTVRQYVSLPFRYVSWPRQKTMNGQIRFYLITLVILLTETRFSAQSSEGEIHTRVALHLTVTRWARDFMSRNEP